MNINILDQLNYITALGSLRNTRRFRNNPLDELSERQIFDRFHFSRAGIEFIFDLIRNDITRSGSRFSDILPLHQLLATLRFYSTGSFQIIVGDTIHISQPSVSIIVAKISRIIAKKRPMFIIFPKDQEATRQQNIFRNIALMPGVTGAIDCTHIRILSPGGARAELFRNRKGYFSINVQAVCNAEDIFTNVVARWPGSVHDSRIFDNSYLKYQLENSEVPGILLGDSGYALATYLLTPLLRPEGQKERRYNYSQIRTRNTIERAFGQLKKKFPCLLEFLRVKLPTVLNIIIACFTLHNIAKMLNEDEIVGPMPNGDNFNQYRRNAGNTTANAYRKAFIERNF